MLTPQEAITDAGSVASFFMENLPESCNSDLQWLGWGSAIHKLSGCWSQRSCSFTGIPTHQGVTSPVTSALNLHFHLCGRDITSRALYSVGLGGQTQVVRFGFTHFPNSQTKTESCCCADQAGLEQASLPDSTSHMQALQACVTAVYVQQRQNLSLLPMVAQNSLCRPGWLLPTSAFQVKLTGSSPQAWLWNIGVWMEDYLAFSISYWLS